MVLLKEFRILMPFSLEEYNIGQRYATARMSKEASEQSGGKDGVELKEMKTYFDEKVKVEGIYTYKVYYIGGYLPHWLLKVLPANALLLEEKCWNAYPYCKTELSSPFLGEKFQFTIESMHVANDVGMQENALNLSKEQLKERKISFIDISMDQLVDKKYNTAAEDPTKVTHTKTPIKRKGPLSKNWQKEVKAAPKAENFICCYKLVTGKFSYPGLQSKAEGYIISTEREIFLRFHKLLYVWADDWCGLTLDQVSAEENKLYTASAQTLSKDIKDQITAPNNLAPVTISGEVVNDEEEEGKEEEIQENKD